MSSGSNNNEAFKLSNLFDVKGKVALITGGGTVIGLMATQALAVNGTKVYICGRTKEKLDRVAELYGKDIAGEIIPIQAEVSKKDEIKKLWEAGSAEERSKNLFDDKDETFEMWTDTYRTNVAQCYFMTTAFLPLLQNSTETHKGYSGTVINISPISGIVETSQHHYAYNASKAACIHLTTMLSSDIAQTGLKIRVNSIAPGVFPSEMTAGDSDDKQKSFIPKEKYEDKVPAQRPGKDEDMANAILFAATNQYLNGITILVNVGYVIKHGAGP